MDNLIIYIFYLLAQSSLASWNSYHIVKWESWTTKVA